MKAKLSSVFSKSKELSQRISAYLISRRAACANVALAIFGVIILSAGINQTSIAEVKFNVGGNVCTGDFCIGGGIGTGGGGRYGGGFAGNPGIGVDQGDYRINEMNWRLFELIEGNLGALIMISAGIAAIVSAAFGAYRAAVSLLAVAIGAFVLRSLVDIFFDFY